MEIYGQAPRAGSWTLTITATDGFQSIGTDLILNSRGLNPIDFQEHKINVFSGTSFEATLTAMVRNEHPDFQILAFYDSHAFSLNGISNPLDGVTIHTSEIQQDLENLDGDSKTGSYLTISIEDLRTDLTDGEEQTELMDLNFVAADELTGLLPSNLNLRYKNQDSPTLTSIPSLEVVHNEQDLNFNLDVDGNGSISALGDGLMVIRKLFGEAFKDDALTNKAVDPSYATRNTSEIHSYIQQGLDTGLLDVDRDGKTTALGDGLMIIRYLFGQAFSGSALTSKAMSPDSSYSNEEQPWISVATNIEQLL